MRKSSFLPAYCKSEAVFTPGFDSLTPNRWTWELSTRAVICALIFRLSRNLFFVLTPFLFGAAYVLELTQFETATQVKNVFMVFAVISLALVGALEHCQRTGKHQLTCLPIELLVAPAAGYLIGKSGAYWLDCLQPFLHNQLSYETVKRGVILTTITIALTAIMDYFHQNEREFLSIAIDAQCNVILQEMNGRMQYVVIDEEGTSTIAYVGAPQAWLPPAYMLAFGCLIALLTAFLATARMQLLTLNVPAKGLVFALAVALIITALIVRWLSKIGRRIFSPSDYGGNLW